MTPVRGAESTHRAEDLLTCVDDEKRLGTGWGHHRRLGDLPGGGGDV